MKIVEFLKKLIEVKDDDLSFLNVGDIIWAKRYKAEEEREKIEFGHQESPYIIIKKQRKKVYALQCTSNPHQEVKWKMLYYQLGKESYNMNKNCYINCLKEYELKEIQFVEIIGHLTDDDLNRLKKQIYILINSSFKYKPMLEEKYLDYKIGVGDIVLKDDNKYYIYDMDNLYLYVYRLRKNIKTNNNILINNTYYSFIFHLPEVIKIKDKYKLVDTFNTGEIEVINKYKNDYHETHTNNPKSLRVGAIIEYKDNLYYVYNIDDEMIYLYQVYLNSLPKGNMIDIKVKGGIYRTYFSTRIFDLFKLNNNGYKVKRCANEAEIEYNNKIFLLPKNRRYIEERKNYKPNFTKAYKNTKDFIPMSIIKNKNNNKYYLIISREDNVVELVNINDMRDTYYFELEEGNCPFQYYRILSKEEYDIYVSKINELKAITNMFDNKTF